MSLVLYPPSPIEKKEPAISAGFKKQASKVVVSIFAFFLVFLLILAAVTALAIGSFFLGITIMASLLSLMGIVLGAGVMIAGASLLFFVIKFAFATEKEDHSHLVEIKKEDQPRLFDFLKQLTDEIGTSFPHKVYLSADVNAACYIRPTFMNMFFPSRKNLVIGVGMVNAVNISEFKAIMAHEFGHFSQKSVKIGPLIYNVNRVIFNMLFENTGYIKFIQHWSSINWMLSLLGLFTFKMMQLIQWVLRGMYRLININYYSLSREMEHNADDIAASVAGGNNLMSGLSKLSPASDAYDYALHLANELVAKNKKVKNMYYAQSYNLINSQYEEKNSRVNFKNQWASHPSNEERKKHLGEMNVNIDPVEKSTWLLFDHKEEVQNTVTDNLYRTVNFESTPELLDGSDYESWVTEHKRKQKFPDVYKGFYNNRYLMIERADIENLLKDRQETVSEEIFTEENGKLYSSMIDYSNDLKTVNAIASKDIKVKTFDFDGKKYSATETSVASEKLQADINALEHKIRELEKEAFVYCCNNSSDKPGVVALYMHFYNKQDISKKYASQIDEGMRTLYSIRDGITIDAANHVAEKLRELEGSFIKKIYDEIGAENFTNEDLRSKLAAFRSKSYVYFSGDSFMPNEVQEFSELFFLLAAEIDMEVSRAYREMLEGQIR